MKEEVIALLEERGVFLYDIADVVYDLQYPYNNSITKQECLDAVVKTLDKREVIHAVLTGISIDKAVEKHLFAPSINDVINKDEGLYGVDEVLAFSILNVYGSIAFTSFGYLDKTKPKIIGIIDNLGKQKNVCHTFLDDIICAIASAAASKIAHK